MITRALFSVGFALALAQSAISPLAAQGAPSPDTVVVRVDGQPITEADIAAAIEELGSGTAQMDDAQKRAYALEYLVDLKIVSGAGDRERLEENPELKKRLELARQRVIMEALLTREGRRGATEPAMRAFYDETVKALKPEPEVRARHILVETEDAAKSALERVRKGEDFAAVATELSKDPGSGKDGGDLGYFTKDRMVPEFAEAAFKLDKGGVSEIVKSQFGFHVIKVEDKRDRQPPPFDQVKEQLSRYLLQKSQQDYVLKLRSEAKVEQVAPTEPKKN